MSIREKDYIMKLLEQFYLALNKLLYGDVEEKIDFIAFEEKFYSGYLENSPQFFLTAPADEIIQYIEQKFPYKEFAVRLEILCELLFQHIENDKNYQENSLSEKLLDLYNRLDTCTKTFSIERDFKINIIKSKLNPQ